MADKWFDYSTYMANKRAQLNAADPSANWTAEQVADAFEQAGFKGVDGAQQHFEQYGHTAEENLSPNANFIPSQYYIFKAADYFDKAVADVTEEQAAYIQAAIKDAGMSAWDHYTQYGTKEGINPSNNFDTQKYLEAKAAALNAAAADGKTNWTAEDVAEAFAAAGMNALEHAMVYADGSEGEAAAAFDANGKPTGAYEVENPVDAGDGETYELTAGIDDLPGTTGDDTFNAVDGTVTALDTIGGKGGSDTLNIVDAGSLTNAEIGGANVADTVKTVNLSTTAAGPDLDFSSWTGVKQFTIKSSDAGATTFEVSENATVDVTSAVSGNGIALTITGGKSVAVTAKAAEIVNLTSNALAEVTLNGPTTAAQAVTVANATADHDLALNLVGYTGGANTFNDNTAKTLTVTATGDASALNFGATNAALKTITVTDKSEADLAVDLSTATATVETFDGSAATGKIDLSAGFNNASIKTIKTGAGDDVVTVNQALVAGTTIDLGDGADNLLYATNGAIAGTSGSDVTKVDGGAGTDTVALVMIGEANVACFTNFEQFDVAALSKNYSQTTLDSHNTVTNFIGTDEIGATDQAITDMGAGVGFIVKGDMSGAGNNNYNLKLTQATAGALTITSDVDRDEQAGAVANVTAATFEATNATSINAVFDNTDGNDVANTATLTITGNAATTALNITSGGTNVTNTLAFTGVDAGTGTDALTTVKVSGDQVLNFTYTKGAAAGISSVDASGMTDGGLTFAANVNTLATGATVKLGGGDDKITLTAADDSAATKDTVFKIADLGLGSAAGATTQDGFDVLEMAGATGAATAKDAVTMNITNGKVAWVGTGPATLAEAIGILIDGNHGLAAGNGVVVFTQGGQTYLYGAGTNAASAGDDFLVQLTGVSFSDVNGVDVAGANNVYVY